MSTGLVWDQTFGTNGLTVTPATAAYTALADTDSEFDTNATWQIVFADSVVQSLRGQDITITYRAQVTAAAVTAGEKENEVKLTYDNRNYVLTDTVDFETYFAGIYKVDPADDSADMSGVVFYLKDGAGTDVNVSYDSTNGYYVVDPNGTNNEVETRADGTNYTIKIRGLDNDKTYTLTEKSTKNGYNLLNGTVPLTKIKDEGTAFSGKAANTYDRVENKKGAELPSTGGIGTTIFYVAGIVLVLGAAAIIIARRKAEQN